jgi:hypothetical protein
MCQGLKPLFSRLLSALVALSCAPQLLACEDESAPSIVEPTGTQVMMREALPDVGVLDMDPTPPPPPPPDAAPPVDMMAPPPITDPDCTEGDLRQKQPCGYERCTRGAWEVPSSPRESCNEHDDDCDGTADEGFNVGANCFTRVDGCSTPGEFVCNTMTQSVMCEPDPTPMRDEVCDGVDNDCDNMVDEGFPSDPVCCTESVHCPPGGVCMSGVCSGQSVNPTNPTDPTDPTDPMSPGGGLMGGSCASPIQMPSFGVYSADGSNAQKVLYAFDCPGTDTALLTPFGSEVVFSFRLAQTQRVRLSTELSFFASVLYVRRGACEDAFGQTDFCDSSVLGLLGDPPHSAELTFEAQANQLYYVVLDTKADLVELLEIGGGMELFDIPFILNFAPAP